MDRQPYGSILREETEKGKTCEDEYIEVYLEKRMDLNIKRPEAVGRVYS